jgi:DNA-binding transcriptional ArsR family regulator
MSKLAIDIRHLEETAARLRAISHPMRIAIITLLDSAAKLNVTQIYNRLKIEQAAASHHLNILKSKGILVSKRVGKQTYYSLKQGALTRLIECINKCSG